MSSIVDYPFSILQSLLVKRYGISVLQMTTDLLLRNICVTNDHGFVVTEYLCYKWSRICCYGIYVLHMTTNLLLRNICVTNDHGFVVTEYMCYTWPRICCYGISVLQMTTDLLLWNICVTNDHGFVPFLCDNHNSVMSSCMTYHGVYNKSNTMDATNVAGTVYPTWAPEFTPGF